MKDIFVFGSNLAGRHGKGAALYARKHYEAIYGQGSGNQGNSWAIPTKDENLRTLSLGAIKAYINDFIKYVHLHQYDSLQLRYIITPVGCGLAGYKPQDIAPMFSPLKGFKNVLFPEEFVGLL